MKPEPAHPDRDPEAERKREVAFILRRAKGRAELRGARAVDVDYVYAVLALYYDCLTERQGAIEVPKEDEWIPEAIGEPGIDGEEEARFVLDRLQSVHGVAPGRRRRLTRRLVEAVLDAQVEFLVSKGIAFDVEEGP